MRRGGTRAARLTGLLLATAGLWAGTGSAQASVCQPAGSELVRSNSKATIYRKQSGDRRTYFGCMKSSGRQTQLTSVRVGLSSVRFLKLHAHFAGFIREGRNTRVKLFDLGSGRHVTRDPAPGTVSDLVASKNGRVAWIIDYHYKSVNWSSFSTGPHEIDEDLCSAYDPSMCIKAGSLRLTGQHDDREIAWIHSRQTHKFVMP